MFFKCLVVSNLEFENWVLGGNSRDIFSNQPKKSIRWLVSSRVSIRTIIGILLIIFSKKLIFINQNTFYQFILIEKILKLKSIIILYTHTNSPVTSNQIQILKKSTVICLNSQEKSYLVKNGLSEAQIKVRPTGVKFEEFSCSTVSKMPKSVILVSDFGLRKNPNLIFSTVSFCQEFNFTLIGRNWEKYNRFAQLNEFPNFNYVEYSKKDYKNYLDKAKIFLSLSNLEGGPLPLIESMAMNVVPVCTDTGYAPDIIQHGVNGFILPIPASVHTIKDSLFLANKLEILPRESVLDLTYSNYINLFSFNDFSN